MAYGFYADVSPDGSQIVYSTCEYPLTEWDEEAQGMAAQGYELAMIGADGTSKLRLTDNDSFEHYPAWSPDGTKIAFLVNDGSHDYQDAAQLAILSLPTGHVRLLPQPSRLALSPPAWSPDGQHLAVAVNEGEVVGWSESYVRALYVVRADGSAVHRIGPATTPATWSPDGRYLAFGLTEVTEEDGSYTGLYTVRRDGMDMRRLWDREIADFRQDWNWDDPSIRNGQISNVVWSPDGSEILFVSEGVHVIRPDGNGLRTLSGGSMRSTRAAWSPDGQRIVTHHPNYQIISVELDGSDMRTLMEIPVSTETCSNGSSVYRRGWWEEPNPNNCFTLLTVRNHFADRGIFLPWSTSVHMFAWPGVSLIETYDDYGGGGVSGLDLRDKGLTGSIPVEIFELSPLYGLDLGNNDLEGEIPPSLGALTYLWELDLSGNRLEGEIPASLGNLTDLRELDLSGNRLGGEIPASLGNLAGLLTLDLSGNRLGGEIPLALGSLVDLLELDISNNRLTGKIPPELGNLGKGAWNDYYFLRKLNLSFNELYGTLPPELAPLNPASLSLEGNNFVGCVPLKLGQQWVEASGLEYCEPG